MKLRTRTIVGVATAAALSASGFTALNGASAHPVGPRQSTPVEVEVFAPENGDDAGIGGAGWFVDIELNFHRAPLKATGFSALQLTGPGAHNNIAPFPGTFSTGKDDRLPGLVVLTSTTNNTLPGFSGPGTNLANLFNLSGVTNRGRHGTELWDTWIVGAPIAGKDVDTTLTVAVIKDLDGNGVYDDAPAVIPDKNSDGRIDRQDLNAIGVASNIETIKFHLNGDPA